MVITPQEFPVSDSRRSPFVALVSILILLVLVGLLATGWWFREDLALFLNWGPDRTPEPEVSTTTPPLPDLSVLESSLFVSLRRFDTLAATVATSSPRTNPFAPF